MQYFRRVMVAAKGLPREQLGPLRYSGQFKKHADVKAGVDHVEWFVVFWFWVPPEKRDTRNLTTAPSKVTPVHDFERRALAEGEIEEVVFYQKFPIGMPMAARKDYLMALWNAEFRRRLPGVDPAACGYGSTAAPATTIGERVAAAG